MLARSTSGMFIQMKKEGMNAPIHTHLPTYIGGEKEKRREEKRRKRQFDEV